VCPTYLHLPGEELTKTTPKPPNTGSPAYYEPGGTASSPAGTRLEILIILPSRLDTRYRAVTFHSPRRITVSPLALWTLETCRS
ncbi:hypothetical protein P7K49_036500, partial [Saguinus oedipus]